MDDTLSPDVSEGSATTPDHGLNALYVRHWSEICNYLRKKFGAGPPAPEDVAQEAFIKFASVENRREIDNPRAYLYRTAHNVYIDEHRRLRQHAVPGIEAKPSDLRDDRTPERVLAGRQLLDLLSSALLVMPAVRRRSFLLNRLHGHSCAAIARLTGYSESAVKKHLDLAMIDLEAAVAKAEREAP